MTNISTLLPCPFCGATDVGFGRTGQKWQTVACNECGAEGPCTEISQDKIIEQWNTRALPPAGMSALADDDLVALVRQFWDDDTQKTLIRAIWKDGIDICVPSSRLKSFVAALRSASRTAPSREEDSDMAHVRSALETLSNPLSIQVEGQFVGVARALAIIERMRNIAATALLSLSETAASRTGEWQPIETAPKDGTAVLLGFWYRGRFAQYQAFYSPNGWMENSRRRHPEHFQKWFSLWCPMPAPPYAQSGE